MLAERQTATMMGWDTYVEITDMNTNLKKVLFSAPMLMSLVLIVGWTLFAGYSQDQPVQQVWASRTIEHGDCTECGKSVLLFVVQDCGFCQTCINKDFDRCEKQTPIQPTDSLKQQLDRIEQKLDQYLEQSNVQNR